MITLPLKFIIGSITDYINLKQYDHVVENYYDIVECFDHKIFGIYVTDSTREAFSDSPGDEELYDYIKKNRPELLKGLGIFCDIFQEDKFDINPEKVLNYGRDYLNDDQYVKLKTKLTNYFDIN